MQLFLAVRVVLCWKRRSLAWRLSSWQNSVFFFSVSEKDIRGAEAECNILFTAFSIFFMKQQKKRTTNITDLTEPITHSHTVALWCCVSSVNERLQHRYNRELSKSGVNLVLMHRILDSRRLQIELTRSSLILVQRERFVCESNVTIKLQVTAEVTQRWWWED